MKVEEDSEYDALEHAFASPDAPEFAITAIDIHRSTITYVGDTESDDDEDGLHWHISGFHGAESKTPLILFGDLSSTEDSWFVSATVVAIVAFRESSGYDFDDDDTIRDLTSRLAPWVSTILYDVAAGVARSLIATNISCEIDIPMVTPRPSIFGPGGEFLDV